MSDISAIIEKVKKLLSLSTSSNANEAAVATAAANRIIDQYRLSTADLETSLEPEELVEEDDGYIYESGRINPWKSSLVNVLVNHYGLTFWNDCHWITGRQVSRYKLVGRRSDIEIAKYMFSWLTAECQRLSDLEAKGKGRVYVGSYCAGFVKGIATQLGSSRAEAQKTASSSAIIKINARSEEAELAMHTLHNNLRSSKSYSKTHIDRDAFSKGKSKGEAMHLGSSLSGGNVKLLNK